MSQRVAPLIVLLDLNTETAVCNYPRGYSFNLHQQLRLLHNLSLKYII